jgi:hypothetical protein
MGNFQPPDGGNGNVGFPDMGNGNFQPPDGANGNGGFPNMGSGDFQRPDFANGNGGQMRGGPMGAGNQQQTTTSPDTLLATLIVLFATVGVTVFIALRSKKI